MFRPLLLIKSLVLGSLLCSLSFSTYADLEEMNPSARENTLVVGVISSNPKKAFKRTQPFADYLASQLEHHNITSARIAVAKDTMQMANWLQNGQVDLLSDTAFSAYELVKDVDAQMLARRWKSGVAEYSTVFFSHSDNNIQSFEDLKGKVIAFEDRGSTSAFIIPSALLLQQGYELYELSSLRELPPADKIGYIFADEFSRKGGETNMMSWVHRKITAASAFSNLDWQEEIPDRIKPELNIFYTSQSIPRGIVLARHDMPLTLKNDLITILLSAHKNKAGQQALAAYKKTKKFDAISPSIKQSIDRVGEMKTLLNSHLVN
ncbi:phosphate/phosphite/phosphonate ABC transporter substrate-binding protein [Vibrio sp. 404]|uniref:Phosphate/phosphite/phosphonate ABC transporter substrate-binding protein n=1 Tax=Vibrio marinisediminis TaxID=2758441 RepID=A0A7W2FQQ1_9VIBR|nr:phosphate/phosphite/phosphonate ABC transporter substrate-binding protein [Vibrio marinisediminis]MBA5762525.1 phosphate/phosphite/phosphonate ABC transporter substrate-binding protein [Vibrio marinisediminis]